MDAPLGQVGRTARRLFSYHQVFPAKYVDMAQAFVQADLEICEERLGRCLPRKPGEKS
jgi:hypothetical protein